MHNDVFANARITNSVIQRNLGNGVSTRGSFFQLFNCTLAENTAAGFEYNPSYTTYEALQVIISWCLVVVVGDTDYRDGAGNTTEKNSSIFTLIRMH